MRFEVQSEIFDAFPGMCIIAVVASGVENDRPYPAVTAAWEDVWRAASVGNEHPNSQSHPRVRLWREAFQATGVSGKKFPSSIEALLRRAMKGGGPFSINPLVDFYNTVSLRHVVPAGGFDLADVESDLALRRTRSGDTFRALDDDQAVGVADGEVAYLSGSDVLTRHFVWRQSRKALILPTTTDVVLVSEILEGVPAGVASSVARELSGGMESLFGVGGTSFIVDVDNPAIDW